jgi:LysM repeat protein
MLKIVSTYSFIDDELLEQPVKESYTMESVLMQNRSSRSSVVILSMFLVITIVLSGFPQSQAAAVTCKYKHTVKAGETLLYLSGLYQINWEDIAEANNLTTPYTITAGQVLCIPYGEDTTTTTETKKGKEPKVDIVPNMGNILIAVENFPKKMSYYVKINPVGTSLSYHIGNFTTNKEGDFTGWFKIPLSIPRSAQMRVCIKNVWSDAVTCLTYTDPYIVPVYLYPKCKPQKEPR